MCSETWLEAALATARAGPREDEAATIGPSLHKPEPGIPPHALRLSFSCIPSFAPSVLSFPDLSRWDLDRRHDIAGIHDALRPIREFLIVDTGVGGRDDDEVES